MTGAHQNPPTQRQLSLTPEQLASYLLIEHVLTCMQSAMNQTGGFLKQADVGDALGEAQALLGKRKEALLEKWSRKVQLVGADALAVIESKVH